jgi:methylmalonyl-CoA mutase N-terminal domain/subunit
VYDRRDIERLSALREEWARREIRPGSERRERFETTSGIEVPRAALPCDAPLDHDRDLGLPGEFPFTRGVHPTMYRGRTWTMRQYAGFATARASNERYRALLAAGTTGLSVAFDLPTQMGYDSDDPAALGEVGKVGVAIDSLADMEILLADIDLSQVTISMTINATASILLAMVLAVARRRGVAWEALGGTVQNDVLKEYLARGTYVVPPEPAMRLTTDVIEFCTQRVPRWNPISISGYHVREAGATAVQEVAFTLANGLAYAQACMARGLPFDAVGPRLSFFFNAHENLLEEVAKFRAARRLWARLVRERHGASDAAAKLRFHAQTAGSTLTAQQPDVNVVRVTLQCLAAVLGGCQSLHANGRDEALSLPTEESARLALRTQQVIALESGVADSVDPLGGSFLVEYMTERIEQGARVYLERLDAMGGVVAALPTGYVQKEIAEAAYRAQLAVDRHERIVVGVNRFQVEEPVREPLVRVDESVASEQRASLERVRRERDGARVARALARVDEACRSSENLMEPILEAVESLATLGEIAACWTRAWGRHRESFA